MTCQSSSKQLASAYTRQSEVVDRTFLLWYAGAEDLLEGTYDGFAGGVGADEPGFDPVPDLRRFSACVKEVLEEQSWLLALAVKRRIRRICHSILPCLRWRR